MSPLAHSEADVRGVAVTTGDPPRSGPQSAPRSFVEVGAGDILAERYALERLIGSGGMGKVWKGTHLALGIPVAVKTLHGKFAASPESARRFRREAHAASLLNHPSVVHVLDFGEHRGTFFMVMEYLEGCSLGAWIEALPAPPPLAEVCAILLPLLDACEVAHAAGVVHRDLKPENVFLTALDGRRRVRVVDFGLAHVDDASDRGPSLTAEDAIAGTPEYMSPEQCESLAVGPSTDIYAVGCLLTTLLQKRPPFTGRSGIEVLVKQMHSVPPPLDRPPLAEPVPAALERLRLDLLAKVPADRPRDAAEVRERLLAACGLTDGALASPTPRAVEARAAVVRVDADGASASPPPISAVRMVATLPLAPGALADPTAKAHPYRPIDRTAKMPGALVAPAASHAEPAAKRSKLTPWPPVPAARVPLHRRRPRRLLGLFAVLAVIGVAVATAGIVAHARGAAAPAREPPGPAVMRP
jgi:serine/threonine-protein kinase